MYWPQPTLGGYLRAPTPQTGSIVLEWYRVKMSKKMISKPPYAIYILLAPRNLLQAELSRWYATSSCRVLRHPDPHWEYPPDPHFYIPF